MGRCESSRSCKLLVILALGLAGFLQTCSGLQGEVKILLMLPLSDYNSNETGIWDRGLEILPGAQLAVEKINSNSHILPDCNLTLVTRSIDVCEEDQFANNVQALIPFAEIASDPTSNVLGIVGGPFCPPLLSRLVSPLASRDEVRLFQMSGSTAGTVHQENRDIHFITPSIGLYYETMYAMSERFNWSKIYIISDTFFKGLTSVKGSSELNITFRQFFSSSPSSLLFSDLRHSEKTIIFASLQNPQDAVNVLCQARNRSLISPHYTWVFHDLSPALIRASNEGLCDVLQLEEAMNGVFFLQFPFESPNTTLVSGDTFSDYHAEYTSRLDADLSSNSYANVVHDAIWAFSLVLNLSLTSMDQSLTELLEAGEKQALIELMDNTLPNVSFQGASGDIHFSERVVNDAVHIYLHYNHSTTYAGSYNTTHNISLAGDVLSLVSGDTLSSVYVLIPIPIAAILGASIFVCIVLTTLVLVLFIYFRKESDIKATSPVLSSFMFLGCYILFVSTLIHVIRGVVVVTGVWRVLVCGAIISGDSLSVNIIFTTLLLRMLRVYRIFSHFGKTSKLWSNRNMVCVVGAVALLDMGVIVVWSLLDTFTVTDSVTFQPYSSPPQYQVKQFCNSQHLTIWLSVVLGKLGLLFAIVLFLAIKTRKIRRSNFKDTKKVNIYIFSTVMLVITSMTLFSVFLATENTLAAHLMIYFAFASTGLLCQVFLFVPKVMSPLLKRCGYQVSYDTKTRRPTLCKQQESRPSITLMTSGNYFTGIG